MLLQICWLQRSARTVISYFLAAQGFFAAQGFLAAQGFAAQGLDFIAHGFPFIAQGFFIAPQGFLGFLAEPLGLKVFWTSAA